MATYRLHIEGTITARNLESAKKKLEDLKNRIERKVEWSEVHLTGTTQLDNERRG